MLRDSIADVQFSVTRLTEKKLGYTMTHTHDLAVADVLSAAFYVNFRIGWMARLGTDHNR